MGNKNIYTDIENIGEIKRLNDISARVDESATDDFAEDDFQMFFEHFLPDIEKLGDEVDADMGKLRTFDIDRVKSGFKKLKELAFAGVVLSAPTLMTAAGASMAGFHKGDPLLCTAGVALAGIGTLANIKMIGDIHENLKSQREAEEREYNGHNDAPRDAQPKDNKNKYDENEHETPDAGIDTMV